MAEHSFLFRRVLQGTTNKAWVYQKKSAPQAKGGNDLKAYIAGKITGDSDYKKKFARAKSCLENEGFVVLNPAELPEGMRPADYMRICMAMIDSSDVVAFLPDYDMSRGARVEWAYVQYVGKTTMYMEHMSFYKNEEE